MKTYTLEELKLAQAKGCRIVYFDQVEGWIDFSKEVLTHEHLDVICIHPADEWRARLPRLREGAKWHRDDFTNEMLEGGHRPLVDDEDIDGSDEILINGIWHGAMHGLPASPLACHLRTRRPAPPEFLHESELAAPSTPAPDYGEPWNKEMYNTELGNTGDYENHLEIFDRNNGRRVAECCNPDDENEADFDRIIACVNSMAGVPDPAAFVAEAKEMREALNELANMPEYDQDDAHRMRHKAKIALHLQSFLP